MARTILSLSLALALASGATSQEVKVEPQKVDRSAAAKQDPKKPAEIDRIDELKRQLERTRAELEATKKMVAQGGLPKRVKPNLTSRDRGGRTLDLGVEATQVPVPPDEFGPAPTKESVVRLLGDGEKEKLGPNVIATVDGQPITKQEFDDVLAYYQSRSDVANEEQNKREALRALVIQKGALAAFQDKAPAARERMAEVERLLANGEDFAAVAKVQSDCPSKTQGGDLGEFGRGVMDPMFEKAAFQTKVGAVSGVVQSAFGYHLVKVTGHEKGEKPQDETVHASHILVMFDADQNAIRQKMMDAMSGRVDLAFANDDWRKLSPF